MDILVKGLDVVAEGRVSATKKRVLFGKITKTNAHSFRAEFTRENLFENGLLISHNQPTSVTASFRFGKILNNGRYTYTAKIDGNKYIITLF